MDKPPKEVELFFAICSVIASIVMFAVTAYCFNQYVDAVGGPRQRFGHDAYLALAFFSLIAIFLTSVMMLLSAYNNEETSRFIKIIRNLVIGYPIAIVIIYTAIFGALSFHERNIFVDALLLLQIIPVLMIIAVNIMNYIAIPFLRKKLVWVLYAVAQTLFLIHCYISLSISIEFAANV